MTPEFNMGVAYKYSFFLIKFGNKHTFHLDCIFISYRLYIYLEKLFVGLRTDGEQRSPFLSQLNPFFSFSTAGIIIEFKKSSWIRYPEYDANREWGLKNLAFVQREEILTILSPSPTTEAIQSIHFKFYFASSVLHFQINVCIFSYLETK